MRVRIGLVGAGSAALRAHLPALTGAEEADHVRVVGVVDPRSDHRLEVVRRCPGALGFEDVGAMLEQTRPDLVVIASPPSSHVASVRAAFESEVDVVCEKPLGVADGDVETLEYLVACHPDRVLVPVHQYRFAPAWERIRAAARAALDAGHTVRLTHEVERPGTDPLSSGGWRSAGLREGGILGDHGVHHLALLWTVDPRVRVLDSAQDGQSGHETARVQLELDGGQGIADVLVTYAGTLRRNLVELIVDGRPALRWLDGDLTGHEVGTPPQTTEPTASLSDRQAVNDLYADLYADLLAQRTEPAWRAERTGEAVTVARLLSTALAAVRRPAGPRRSDT